MIDSLALISTTLPILYLFYKCQRTDDNDE